MNQSETARSGSKDAWDAKFEGLAEEPEEAAEAPGVTPSSTEAAAPSPAPADMAAGKVPDGSAREETVEVQPPAEGATDAQPAAPSTTGDAAPTNTPDIQPEPFVPRVDGRELEIPGALLSGDFIVMRKDAWLRGVQPHLRHQGVWQAREAQHRRELEAKSESEVKAGALLDHFAGLMEKGPEAVLDWLQNFDANRGLLERDLELAALKARDGARTKQDEAGQQEARARAFEAWRPGALKGALDDMLRQPEFKDAGLDAKVLLGKFDAFGNDLFFTATEDIPEWGVKKGQISIDYGRMFRLLRADAQMVASLRSGMKETQRAQETNAAAVGATPPKAPPAVSAKGSPTPGGKNKKPASYDEWEDVALGRKS